MILIYFKKIIDSYVTLGVLTLLFLLTQYQKEKAEEKYKLKVKQEYLRFEKQKLEKISELENILKCLKKNEKI